MIPSLRKKYNQEYSPEQYQEFMRSLEQDLKHPVLFRVAETPVFVDAAFKNLLLTACDSIFDTLLTSEFYEKSTGALKGMPVIPGNEGKPVFMQLDFGVCEEDGQLIPQLIEIQGFPSLYFYQIDLANNFRKHFDIPTDMLSYLNGYDEASYIEILRTIIVGASDPKNVILLEIEPEKQSTNIDFYSTAKTIGIKVLCLTKLKKEGKTLYYLDDEGQRVSIDKIYNRVIFDDLDKRKDLTFEFNFSDEVDVEWIGHPNWFFRISKYSLPLIQNKFVPETRFLSDITELPSDLENYVLKPLFSFAGMGVLIHVTPEDIAAIEDKENYILQKKVSYKPVVETLDVPAKCEIRMMAVWHPDEARPKVINNICRLSKGEMVGVRYNKDKEWVGGTVCFFEN